MAPPGAVAVRGDRRAAGHLAGGRAQGLGAGLLAAARGVGAWTMTPDETTPIDEGVLDVAPGRRRGDGRLGHAPGRPKTSPGWAIAFACWRWSGRAGTRRASPGGRGPPLSFGRFEVVREIGRGGFGVVYLARDPVLGRDVALKVPRPEMLVTRGRAAAVHARGPGRGGPRPPQHRPGLRGRRAGAGRLHRLGLLRRAVALGLAEGAGTSRCPPRTRPG